MYYVVFCVVGILILSGVVGLKRGLLKTLFGFLAMLVSIGVTYVANPYISSLIIEYTEVDEYIEERVYTKLESDLQKKVAESLKNAGVKEGLGDVAKKETAAMLSEDIDKAAQIDLIDGLDLPDLLKANLIENNNDAVYDLLGITTFYKYLSSYAARLVVNLIAFIVTFIAIRLVFLIIGLIVNKIMADVPILAGINRTTGLLLGLASGLILIWVFMVIASVAFGSAFDNMIAESQLLQFIYNHNIIMKILMNL